MGKGPLEEIDADFMLAMYQGAGTSMDDGTFGGTSGNGFTVTASNVATVFTTAMQKLRLNNVIYAKRFTSGMKMEVPEGMPSTAISPEILTYIELYLGGKDTLLGDKVSTNGYSGYFMGFECFLSNCLPWTGVLALSVNPTDGDTITINSVTLTFKNTVDAGVTPGQVKIASTVDLTRANLTAFINAGGATTVADSTNAGYNAVLNTQAAPNQRRLKNFTAVNDNTADTMTLTAAGWGTVVVSSVLTSASNAWTATKQQLHIIFALSKSGSLVVQKDPSLEENPVSRKIGRDYIAWTVYGIKIFVDQAPQIVQLSVNSSAFTAAAQFAK